MFVVKNTDRTTASSDGPWNKYDPGEQLTL